MLPSLDFTITFNPSRDYLRCVLLIHLMAFVSLLRSSLPLSLVIALLLCIILLLMTMVHRKSPISQLEKISYHPGHWLLHKTDGQAFKYERLSIMFDGGLFFLLACSGINKPKTLVIFKDQITSYQYRVLRVMNHSDEP